MRPMLLAVSVLLLAACSSHDVTGPALVGPHVPTSGPSAGIFFQGNGGALFAFNPTASDCVVSATNTIDCAFTVTGIYGPDTYALRVVGGWLPSYQCVNSHSGKPDRKVLAPLHGYPIYVEQNETGIVVDGSGQYVRTTVSLSHTVFSTNLCATSKKPYTTMQVLAYAPFVGGVYISLDSDPLVNQGLTHTYP